MIKAAVLGSPISHSLSPLIHNMAYTLLGVSGEYSAIEIGEEEFANFFNREKENSWSGFSLTMPLKETVLKTGIAFSQRAQSITSVNTLINDSGNWHGLSTDLLAFEKLIVADRNSKVAIIGGGGTARAAMGALVSKGCDVDVLIRNPNRQEALMRAGQGLRIFFKGMDQSLSDYDLVINTTPAGVADSLVNNLEIVKGVLFESLYAPWPTNLAARWNDLGKPVISGAQLLVEQGLHQIALMTGVNFDFESMRKLLINEVIAAQI